MIQIKPQIVESSNDWISKTQGVIFVEKESDIDVLFQELVKQDSYWKSYKKLIKIAPKQIDKLEDLQMYCQYVGKTDIWEFEELRKKVNFVIYQYSESDYE